MHPLTTPDQSMQYATERVTRLRTQATHWRRSRDATRPTHGTHRPAA